MNGNGAQIRELLPADGIRRRVRELATAISRDYAEKDLLLIGVLKGAVFFVVDLARELEIPVAMDFMSVSSYGASTVSSGIVRITKDLEHSIEGRDVLIVEDIVDSGLTLRYLLETLRARNPRSIRICALLNKLVHNKADVPVDYVGFEIPDEFVVGYGLDYAEQYRNLPYVGVLSLQQP